MIQSRCLSLDGDTGIQGYYLRKETVTLQVKDTELKREYKVVLDESPPGMFTQDPNGFTQTKAFTSNKADIVCFGR